jgi:hypothetical protein
MPVNFTLKNFIFNDFVVEKPPIGHSDEGFMRINAEARGFVLSPMSRCVYGESFYAMVCRSSSRNGLTCAASTSSPMKSELGAALGHRAVPRSELLHM